nr:delta-60 repeat domain-containing protein [Gemmatimonadales bacterium]
MSRLVLRRVKPVLFALAGLLLCAWIPASAQARSVLDPSFGLRGRVTTNFGILPLSGFSRASDVVADRKGRVIVGGTSSLAGARYAVARLLADGTLDP